MPKKEYRALISIPVHGSNDDEAWDDAARAAASLLHPGSSCGRRHVELLTVAVDDDDHRRVISEAHGFVGHNLPARLEDGNVLVIRSHDGPIPEGQEIAGVILSEGP